MDFKKTNAPTTTVTRNLMDLCRDTNNIYESVAIIAKRSNQIAAEMKDELSKKLVEFGSHTAFSIFYYLINKNTLLIPFTKSFPQEFY